MFREDMELAQLAVARGWVTTHDIDLCMREQSAGGMTTLGPRKLRPLGAILVSKGLITDDQLVLLQAEMRAKGGNPLFGQHELIGQILVGSRAITKIDLQAALTEQQQAQGRHRRIGEILVDRRLCTTDHVFEALRRQGKHVLQCTGCQARFNVTAFAKAAHYACPKCAAVLMPGADALDVDDSSVGIRPADESMLPTELAGEHGPKVHFGKFVVTRQLFRSSVGPILRAWQNDRRRFVALLMVPPDFRPALMAKCVQDIAREGEAYGLEIQMLIESGNYEGRHYLSMGLSK